MNKKLIEKIVKEEVRKKLRESSEQNLEKEIYNTLFGILGHARPAEQIRMQAKSLAKYVNWLPEELRDFGLHSYISGMKSYQAEEDFFADNPGLKELDPLLSQNRKEHS